MEDYQKLGFKCGIEIHNRLATKQKLFCACPPRFSFESPEVVLRRKLRAVAGELGAKDRAAVFEYLRDRTFFYECYSKESCLVEADEEPPHPINREALMIALQIAKMLKAEIPDEIHVMRKTVIDGSNPGGFQRTAIIGLNGVLQTSKGPVRITNICLEEESAGIVEQKNGEIVYRLDRLGIPLIEIGTEPDIKDPKHAREVAERLGMLIRSTGKSQRGIGVTRQDINISISGGARVEIKGVQELDLIPKIIENEIQRQIEMITRREKPKPETRVVKPDGTTEFMRPLPGGERMYPETDIPPIVISPELLRKIKLPESWEEKLKRFKKVLPHVMAEQILKSEYLDLYEKYSAFADPVLVASIFTSLIKDLRRKGFNIKNLKDEHFDMLFGNLKQGKIAKEAIPIILEKWCEMPELRIEQMGIKPLTETELREIIKEIFNTYPQLVRDKRISALMGEVMKRVRGRIDGATVARIVKEMLS